ncbi:MAG: DUF433 domain-containing protein [Chthonomonadales bacterium]
MIAAPIEMIELDERGVAYIFGIRIKVTQIAIESKYNGMSPIDIMEAHPDLSLASIYAALSYYYSHSVELDKQITDEFEYVERMRREHQDPLRKADLELRQALRKIA